MRILVTNDDGMDSEGIHVLARALAGTDHDVIVVAPERDWSGAGAAHITLRSIANNPDINEGMSRDEIDAAIKRHADFELLYDKPYEDKKKVRVTGPFTVESLSPHRPIAFAGGNEPTSERETAVDPEAPTFEQTILANLQQAGIQNGRKDERLTFSEVDPYAGQFVQAVGITDQEDEEVARRVGISIGPQYGTVSPSFIKGAAREAMKGDIDLIAILGFAFDPTAIGSIENVVTSDEGFAEVAAERKLGKLPVLLVRMNADLSMGEELKKMGAGNLFTVFGEPDIEITRDDGELVVELRGVDVVNAARDHLCATLTTNRTLLNARSSAAALPSTT